MWIAFLTQGTVTAIFKHIHSDVYEESVGQKMAIAELGMNSGIAKTIMEYLKTALKEKEKEEKKTH